MNDGTVGHDIKDWLGGLFSLTFVMDDVLMLQRELNGGKYLPGQRKTGRGRFGCRRLQRFFVPHEFQPTLHWSISRIVRGEDANGTGFRGEAIHMLSEQINIVNIVSGSTANDK